jgi:cysteine sulfinate desulfinase/cysteine desulfurase-like protein
MRVPEEWGRGTLRLSTGKMTTTAKIKEALSIISNAAVRLKKQA